MDDYLLEPGLGFLSYRINCSLIVFLDPKFLSESDERQRSLPRRNISMYIKTSDCTSFRGLARSPKPNFTCTVDPETRKQGILLKLLIVWNSCGIPLPAETVHVA